MNFPQLSLAGCIRCRCFVFGTRSAAACHLVARFIRRRKSLFCVVRRAKLDNDNAIRRLRHRETKKYP
jgi:hypothetical protein